MSRRNNPRHQHSAWLLSRFRRYRVNDTTPMSSRSPKPTRRNASAKARAQLVHPLLADVQKPILQARDGVARAVDSGLVTVYWHVGR